MTGAPAAPAAPAAASAWLPPRDVGALLAGVGAVFTAGVYHSDKDVAALAEKVVGLRAELDAKYAGSQSEVNAKVTGLKSELDAKLSGARVAAEAEALRVLARQ